jgi:hypothetical protein
LYSEFCGSELAVFYFKSSILWENELNKFSPLCNPILLESKKSVWVKRKYFHKIPSCIDCHFKNWDSSRLQGMSKPESNHWKYVSILTTYLVVPTWVRVHFYANSPSFSKTFPQIIGGFFWANNYHFHVLPSPFLSWLPDHHPLK